MAIKIFILTCAFSAAVVTGIKGIGATTGRNARTTGFRDWPPRIGRVNGRVGRSSSNSLRRINTEVGATSLQGLVDSALAVQQHATVGLRGKGNPSSSPSKALGTGSRSQNLAMRPDFRFQRYVGDFSRSVRARDGFLGVGPIELLVTLGIALALVGPEGLVAAARSIAQFIRDLQPAIRELAESSSDITDTINKELGIDEITETLFSAQRELQSAQDELTATLRDATKKGSLAPPPPPPPPPPSMTSLEDLEDAEDSPATEQPMDTEGSQAEAEFIPPSPEEIEKYKQAQFWNPRDEADASEEGMITSESKLDGAAVFQKAMRLAEEQQQQQQQQATQDVGAVAAADAGSSSTGKQLVELSEEQLKLLAKAEKEAAAEKEKGNTA
mmetsp:Transcript_18388/g.25844  ORF Transcript_18388/g.25844 Transcript_18388/m.25844 type:complete len:386 (-) Transcript_18388:259-1416(-)|eukprot:CAMPEP_0185257350 /NCGR_PEP_ID=MMETSP1359-20130426/6405_1 /TAXON_ID=552665 /ORGANISM="Bigelowiella longifila, Strain CCMP242" /LENGTH=385 /DNA_ID=CAMNT_0027842389 /DNA_START=299 /DNA_END=1456 /DNA_ORIENTATION=+